MSGKTPHIVRTALQNRQRILLLARVASIRQISPTVKSLILQVDDPNRCHFKAGQWLDFFAPDISHVGGFSMCSPPHEFVDKGTLQLAVKSSENLVAKWIHEKCAIGFEARIRFGGDFFYDPASDSENHSIGLIAGGVGANPLISILSETLHHDQTTKAIRRKIVLLQTAKNEDELLFRDETKTLVDNSNGALERFLFVTEPSGNSEITNRRIERIDLQQIIDICGRKTKYFLCGPPAMIDEIHATLTELGISKETIFFEKWT